jgi:hypothetical protein
VCRLGFGFWLCIVKWRRVNLQRYLRTQLAKVRRSDMRVINRHIILSDNVGHHVFD